MLLPTEQNVALHFRFYASAPVTADAICAESGLTAVSSPTLYECLMEFDKHQSRQCWDDKEIMGIDMTSKVLHSKCNYKDRSETFTALLFFNIIVMFFVPLGVSIFYNFKFFAIFARHVTSEAGLWVQVSS